VIPVGRLAPGDQWDQNMLDLLFANMLYPTGLMFKRHEGFPNTDGCILIIPGRYWADQTDQISDAISRYQWVLGIRTGDEEDEFDPERVSHPNIKWWVQTPRPGRNYGDSRLFGIGFPPHFNHLGGDPARDVDVFISAQNTHDRRDDCFDTLKRVTSARVEAYETEGFTQGMAPADYATMMCSAKLAPAPSGPESAESFRVYEALEAHTIPICDDYSPKWNALGYWEHLFPGCPLPVINTYQQLPGYIEDLLYRWPANLNTITAWWMRYKRQWSQWLVDDLTELGAL
jgi:hypothetical protein